MQILTSFSPIWLDFDILIINLNGLARNLNHGKIFDDFLSFLVSNWASHPKMYVSISGLYSKK